MNIETFRERFLEQFAVSCQAGLPAVFQASPEKKPKAEVLSSDEKAWYQSLLKGVNEARSIPAALTVVRRLWLAQKNRKNRLQGLVHDALSEMIASLEASDDAHPDFALRSLLCVFAGNFNVGFHPDIIECFFRDLPLELSADNVNSVASLLCTDDIECFSRAVQQLRLDYSEKDQSFINEALTACSKLLAAKQGKTKEEKLLGTRLQALCEAPVTVPNLPLAVWPASRIDEQLQPLVESQSEKVITRIQRIRRIMNVPLNSDREHWERVMSQRIADFDRDTKQILLDFSDLNDRKAKEDERDKERAQMVAQKRTGAHLRRGWSKVRKYGQLLSTNEFLIAIMENYWSEAQVLASTIASDCRRQDRPWLAAKRRERCRQLRQDLALPLDVPEAAHETFAECHDADTLEQEEQLWRALESKLRRVHDLITKPGNTPLAPCSVRDLYELSTEIILDADRESESACGQDLAQLWLAKYAKHKGSPDYYHVNDVVAVVDVVQPSPELRAFIPQYAPGILISAPTLVEGLDHLREHLKVGQRVVLFDVATGLVHDYYPDGQSDVYDPQHLGLSEPIQTLLSAEKLTVWTDASFYERFKRKLPEIIEHYVAKNRPVVPELNCETDPRWQLLSLEQQQAFKEQDQQTIAMAEAARGQFEMLPNILGTVFRFSQDRTACLQKIDDLDSGVSTQLRDFSALLRPLLDLEPLYQLGIPGLEGVDLGSLTASAEALDQSVDDFEGLSGDTQPEGLQSPLEATVYYVLSHGDKSQKKELWQFLQTESYANKFVWRDSTATFMPRRFQTLTAKMMSGISLDGGLEKRLDPGAQVWFAILCLRLAKWTHAVTEGSLSAQQFQAIVLAVLALKQSSLWRTLSVNEKDRVILSNRQCTYLTESLTTLVQAIVHFNQALPVPMNEMPAFFKAMQVPSWSLQAPDPLFVREVCLEPVSDKLKDWQLKYALNGKGATSVYEAFRAKFKRDLARGSDGGNRLQTALSGLRSLHVADFLNTYAPLELLPSFTDFNATQKRKHTQRLTQAANICLSVIAAAKQTNWYADSVRVIDRLGSFGVQQAELRTQLLTTFFEDLFDSSQSIEPVAAKLGEWSYIEGAGDSVYDIFHAKLRRDLTLSDRTTPLSRALTGLVQANTFNMDDFLDTYAPLELLPAFTNFNTTQKKTYSDQLTKAAKLSLAAMVKAQKDSGDWYTDYAKLISRLAPLGVNRLELQTELLKQLLKQPDILKARHGGDDNQHWQACVDYLGACPSSEEGQRSYVLMLEGLIGGSLEICYENGWWTAVYFEAIQRIFIPTSLPELIQERLKATVNAGIAQLEQNQALTPDGQDRREADELEFAKFLKDFDSELNEYQGKRDGRMGSLFNDTKRKRLEAVKLLRTDIDQLQTDYAAINNLATFQTYQASLKKLTSDIETIIAEIEKREELKRKIARKSGSALLEICLDWLGQLQKNTTVTLWRGLQKSKADIAQVVLNQEALDRIVVRSKKTAQDPVHQRDDAAPVAAGDLSASFTAGDSGVAHNPIHEEPEDDETRSVTSDVSISQDSDYRLIGAAFAVDGPLVERQNTVRASLKACQESLLNYQRDFSNSPWTRFWVRKDRVRDYQGLLKTVDALLMRLDYKIPLEQVVTFHKELGQFWSQVETVHRRIDKDQSRLRQALHPHVDKLQTLRQEINALSSQRAASALQLELTKTCFTQPLPSDYRNLIEPKAYLQVMAEAVWSVCNQHECIKKIFNIDLSQCSSQNISMDCDQLHWFFNCVLDRLKDKFGPNVLDNAQLQPDLNFQQIVAGRQRIAIKWAEMALSQKGFNFERAQGGLDFVKQLGWPVWLAGFEGASFDSDRNRIDQLMWLLTQKGLPAEDFGQDDVGNASYAGYDVSSFKSQLDWALLAVLGDSSARSASHCELSAELVDLYLKMHPLEDYVGGDASYHLNILFKLFGNIAVGDQYPETIERLLQKVLAIVAHPHMNQQILDQVVEKLRPILDDIKDRELDAQPRDPEILTLHQKQHLARLFAPTASGGSASLPTIREVMLTAVNKQDNLPLIELAYKDLTQSLADAVCEVSRAYATADINWQTQLKQTLLGYIPYIVESLQQHASANFEPENMYYLAWLVHGLLVANPSDDLLQSCEQKIVEALQSCLANDSAPNTLRDLLVKGATRAQQLQARTLLIAEKTMVMLSSPSPRASGERGSGFTLSDLTADRDSIAQDLASLESLPHQARVPNIASIKSPSDAILDCFAQTRFDTYFEKSPRHELLHLLAPYADLATPTPAAFQQQSLSQRYVSKCFAWLDSLVAKGQLNGADSLDQIQQLKRQYFVGVTRSPDFDGLMRFLGGFGQDALERGDAAELDYLKKALSYVVAGVDSSRALDDLSPVGLPITASVDDLSGHTDHDTSLGAGRAISLEAMAAKWLDVRVVQAADLKEAVLLLWYRSRGEGARVSVDGDSLSTMGASVASKGSLPSIEAPSADQKQLLNIYDQLEFQIGQLNRQDSVLAPLLSQHAFQQRLLECLGYLKDQLPEQAQECQALMAKVVTFSQPKLAVFNAEFKRLHQDWLALNQYAVTHCQKDAPDLQLKKRLIEQVNVIFLPAFGDTSETPKQGNEAAMATVVEMLRSQKGKFSTIHQELDGGLKKLDSGWQLRRSFTKGTCAQYFDAFEKQLDKVIAIGLTQGKLPHQSSPPRGKPSDSPPGSSRKDVHRSTSTVSNMSGLGRNSSFSDEASLDSRGSSFSGKSPVKHGHSSSSY